MTFTKLTQLLQDSAPDIYETPDLTDDNSTVPVSPRPSSSPLNPPPSHD
jgi:hypothetical protein